MTRPRVGFVTTNRSGSVLITDTGNQRLRMVAARSGTLFGRKMTAGDIYTIAGDGRYGYSGDGGPAVAASFRSPAGVAVDRSGNVLVADASGNRVRVVAAVSGRFYGRAMRTGRVYTIAGTGARGYSGDGGPATRARLNVPYAIALDHAGNVVVTDQFNGRVRVIAEHKGRFYGRRMRAGDIYTVTRLSCLAVAVDAAGNLVLAGQNFIRRGGEGRHLLRPEDEAGPSLHRGRGRAVPVAEKGLQRTASACSSDPTLAVPGDHPDTAVSLVGVGLADGPR
jgi:trimeric autotransporter adhesin